MTQRSGIICAGNWIVDLVHDIAHWPAESDLTLIDNQTRGIGGGPANVIAALARLNTGLALWPMGAVGDDEYGNFIRAECKQLDLPTSQISTKLGTPTAHTHVMSVAGQSRTFFYQGGANDALSADDFPAGTFATTNARLFYLGYLTLLGKLDQVDAAGTTEAARVLERAQKAGLITCVDMVSGHHRQFEAIASAAAPHIDYFVLNEIEAARATGMPIDAGTADPETLARLAAGLIAKGVNQAVVIHSAAHALWAGTDGSQAHVPVTPLPKEQIASHLGAGDAFCAGLLYAIHQAWPAERALRLANATARASLKGMTASLAIPQLDALEF